MDFLMLLFTLIVLLISIGISLLISVPFLSLVIRYRAHYAPRALALPLDADPSSAPSAPLHIQVPLSTPATTGPHIRGILHLLSRIRAQEGWAGLYKGVCPVLLESLLGGITSLLYWGLSTPTRGAGVGTSYAVAPQFGVMAFGWAVFSLLLNLPMTVILNRTITTPYRLPYRPLPSLRLLLSPSELRRPWTLYTLPGLLPTKLCHIAYIVLFIPLTRSLLVPSYHSPDEYENGGWDSRNMGFWGAFGLGAYVVFLIASTAILAPLEIIALRLSLQPLSSSAADQLGTANEDEAPLYSGTDEDVIHLRTPQSAAGEPYVGMVDCWRKICAEEGWRTLARAAWMTALATLAAGFS